jgi:hypothetical protein
VWLFGDLSQFSPQRFLVNIAAFGDEREKMRIGRVADHRFQDHVVGHREAAAEMSVDIFKVIEQAKINDQVEPAHGREIAIEIALLDRKPGATGMLSTGEDYIACAALQAQDIGTKFGQERAYTFIGRSATARMPIMRRAISIMPSGSTSASGPISLPGL